MDKKELLKEELHALMVAFMKEDKDEAYKIKRGLEEYLKGAPEPEIGQFLEALWGVMKVWGWELEKARRLRQALGLFLDNQAIGWREEGNAFYRHHFRHHLR